MQATTILDVIARYLRTIDGHNFQMDDDELWAPGCGWNTASIYEDYSNQTIVCSYDKDLVIDNIDTKLLTKVAKWAKRTQNKINKENKNHKSLF